MQNILRKPQKSDKVRQKRKSLMSVWRIFWAPMSEHIVRQFVHTMFTSNNRASFQLRWKENLLKHQKVSKYYQSDCRYLPFIKNKIMNINSRRTRHRAIGKLCSERKACVMDENGWQRTSGRQMFTTYIYLPMLEQLLDRGITDSYS